MASGTVEGLSLEVVSWFQDTISLLSDHILEVIPHIPRSDAVATLEALIADVHLLIHDERMGSGADLAAAVAGTVQGSHSRIRVTSDLTPSDIVGVTMFNQRDQTWEFHKGPIFAEVGLIDPLQFIRGGVAAALDECLSERFVTVDGTRYQISRPMFVMGIDQSRERQSVADGPAAKAFGAYLHLGSPNFELLRRGVVGWLKGATAAPPRITANAVADLQSIVRRMPITDEAMRRMEMIASSIAESKWFSGGLTMRVLGEWCQCAQVHAVARGAQSVAAEDLDLTAERCLPHRLDRSDRAISSGLSTWEAFDMATQHLVLAKQPAVVSTATRGRTYRALLHTSILEWVAAQDRSTTEDFVAPDSMSASDIQIADAVSWLAAVHLIAGAASGRGHIVRPRLTIEGFEALEDARTPYDFVYARGRIQVRESNIHFGDHAVVYGLQAGGAANTQSIVLLDAYERGKVADLLEGISAAATALDGSSEAGARALTSVNDLVLASREGSVPKATLMSRARDALVLSAAGGGGQALIQGLSELVRLLSG